MLIHALGGEDVFRSVGRAFCSCSGSTSSPAAVSILWSQGPFRQA